MATGDHAGTRRDELSLPFLLHALPRWHPGSWTIPSMFVSGASLIAFILTLAILHGPAASRALFRLPSSALALVAAAVGAGLTMLVIARTLYRPGPPWPFAWAAALGTLAVATVAAAAAELAGIATNVSLIHALALACFLSALVLALRLFRLAPDTRFVPRVAVVAAALAALSVPMPLVLAQTVVADERSRLEDTIKSLRASTAAVRDVAAAERRSPRDPLPGVERLRALSLAGAADNRRAWYGAAFFGRDGDLADSARELLDAVVLAVGGRTAPIVPGRAGGDVEAVGYYRELGRLFHEAERVLAHAPPPRDRTGAEARVRFDATLTKMGHSWARQWAVPVLAGRARAVNLAGVLDMPVGGSSGAAPLRGIDLAHFATLSGASAAQLAHDDTPCRSMTENSAAVVECHAYAAANDLRSLGSVVRLRIVQRGASAGARPDVVLLFEVPQGRRLDEHAADVMRTLQEGVEGRYRTRAAPVRGGAVADGFTFAVHGERFHVVQRTPQTANVVAVQVCAQSCE